MKGSSISVAGLYVTSGGIRRLERTAELPGGMISVIPHITNETKRRIDWFETNGGNVLVEIGTVMTRIVPFLEALRQSAAIWGETITASMLPGCHWGDRRTKNKTDSALCTRAALDWNIAGCNCGTLGLPGDRRPAR
jgi:CTP synthase (UTP-ammonia lyase)